MMDTTLDLPFELFEIKADDGNQVGTFTGLGSTFGNVDSVGDVIEPGTFRDAVQNPAGIKMLWQHDARLPIGTWKSVRETKKGLEVRGQLVLGVQQGREAFDLLKAGAVDALSIGFSDFEAETDAKSGVRRITKLNLWEISIVTFPANRQARIQTVKNAFLAGQVPDRKTLEATLREMLGLSRRQAKAFMARGYAGFAACSDDEVSPEVLAGLKALAAKMRGAVA